MADKTKIHTQYKLRNGESVPSVTTVLGVLAKNALIHWAWKCGRDGLDYKKVRDQAGDVGTLTHYLILCHLKGEPPDLSQYSPEDIDRAETCLIKFWDWLKGKDVKPVLLEEPLVSENYSFGGTPDFLGDVDGKPILLDFKTSAHIYPEMFYQLAAYRYLLGENNYGWVDEARILRIGRNDEEGFEERTITSFDKQWNIFLNCLSIYNLQKQIKKGGE